MAVQTAIFDYVKSLAGLEFTYLLPQGEGYAAQLAPGGENNTYFDGGKDCTLSVLFLGKSKDQRKLIDTLYDLCNKLTVKAKHPYGIKSINVGTSPTLVCKENDMWVWSCIIDVKFNMKGTI